MDLDFLLVRKMKQGDEDAFDLFVRKYYRDILSFCSYRCCDKEDAEDLTQETFIRFFTSLSVYRHKGKIKNYLYTIARHLCMDHQKKVREIPTEDEWLTEKAEDGEQKKDSVLNRLALEAALAKLSEEFREVIILYYFEELKIAEIARLQGLTVSLVKYRLKQAKIQLKQYLRGGEEE